MASPKNTAGTERLARDIARSETEIAYYLYRLDISDETVARGDEDRPLHRKGFERAIASLRRRKDRLARRQGELERCDEKMLVFGETEAKPMGYGRAPKAPSYTLQNVVDVDSGLMIHHGISNDSHLLHPMSIATKGVPEVEKLHMLSDGGYSNAEGIALRERDSIEGPVPIKRGAMTSDHFRPVQFVYDEATGTKRCPAS